MKRTNRQSLVVLVDFPQLSSWTGWASFLACDPQLSWGWISMLSPHASSSQVSTQLWHLLELLDPPWLICSSKQLRLLLLRLWGTFALDDLVFGVLQGMKNTEELERFLWEYILGDEERLRWCAFVMKAKVETYRNFLHNRNYSLTSVGNQWMDEQYQLRAFWQSGP